MTDPYVSVVLANECELRFPTTVWPAIMRAVQDKKATMLATDVHGSPVIVRVDDISFACLMTAEVMESISRE